MARIWEVPAKSTTAEPGDRLDAGKWWHFSEYAIEDWMIGPAPGARFEEYRPWKLYEARPRDPKRRTDANRAPHEKLYDLAVRIARLDPRVRAGNQPDPDAVTLAVWERNTSRAALEEKLRMLRHFTDAAEPKGWVQVGDGPRRESPDAEFVAEFETEVAEARAESYAASERLAALFSAPQG